MLSSHCYNQMKATEGERKWFIFQLSHAIPKWCYDYVSNRVSLYSGQIMYGAIAVVQETFFICVPVGNPSQICNTTSLHHV